MAVILTTQNIGGMSVQFLQQLCGDGHVLRDNGRSARKKIYALYKSLTPKRHRLKIFNSYQNAENLSAIPAPALYPARFYERNASHLRQSLSGSNDAL